TTSSTTTSSTTTSTSATTEPHTSTTSTTTSPTTSSTSSSTTTSSTTVAASSTTTTTLRPACDAAMTMAGVLCRIDSPDVRVTDASPEVGGLATGIGNRVRWAHDDVHRPGSLCAAGRLPRARAALRSAGHRLLATLAKVRSRNGRTQLSPELASELT